MLQNRNTCNYRYCSCLKYYVYFAGSSMKSIFFTRRVLVHVESVSFINIYHSVMSVLDNVLVYTNTFDVRSYHTYPSNLSTHVHVRSSACSYPSLLLSIHQTAFKMLTFEILTWKNTSVNNGITSCIYPRF